MTITTAKPNLVSVGIDPSRELIGVYWDDNSGTPWELELESLNVLRLLDTWLVRHEPEHIGYGMASYALGHAPRRERLMIEQHRVSSRLVAGTEYTSKKNVWEEAVSVLSMPGARAALVEAIEQDEEASKAKADDSLAGILIITQNKSTYYGNSSITGRKAQQEMGSARGQVRAFSQSDCIAQSTSEKRQGLQ